MPLTTHATTIRTIPKTTSGKISRTMCKKAHSSGALDGDTVFLWGDDRMASHLSSAPGTAKEQTAVAEMDMQAERDETGGGGSNAAGTEESKSSGGGKGCPADMTIADILKGVQSEVAKILKADASAIPMVRGEKSATAA